MLKEGTVIKNPLLKALSRGEVSCISIRIAKVGD
jgi:hypothetical protein